MTGSLLPLLGTGSLILIVGVTGFCAFKTLAAPLPSLPSTNSSVTLEAPAPSSARQSRQARSDSFYASITERPLFAPTRRPVEQDMPDTLSAEPEIAPVSIDGTTPERPQLQLHGTMIAADRLSALLSKSDGDPEWLHVGVEIQGWKLSEIGDGWATLQNGEQTFKLEMY